MVVELVAGTMFGLDGNVGPLADWPTYGINTPFALSVSAFAMSMPGATPNPRSALNRQGPTHLGASPEQTTASCLCTLMAVEKVWQTT